MVPGFVPHLGSWILLLSDGPMGYDDDEDLDEVDDYDDDDDDDD